MRVAPPASSLLDSRGLIIRQKEPRNFEFPFDLESYITPVESFYIRSHFPAPVIGSDSYQLKIEGAVGNPFTLSYQELKNLPSTTITATLECAGNSRVFLVPQKPGVQWELGAVGNAEWTGIPLAELLHRAKVKDNACEVVLEGADQGRPDKEPAPAGSIRFARSIPVRKALQDVLIAFQMNGADLTPDHGFPARAIVPDHYGMASVKWLTRVLVSDQPFHGYFQTTDYAYWAGEDDMPVRRALSEMKVKSAIAKPRALEHIAREQLYAVRGAAWSGAAGIVSVELSTDGGSSWAYAKLDDPAQPHAWRRWSYAWTPAKPGPCTLMARAHDADGATQPGTADPRYDSYVVHHTLPVEVIID